MNLLKIGIILGVLSVMPFQLLANSSSSIQVLHSSLESNIQENCQAWPEVIKRMPIGAATITLHSGHKHLFQFRLANTDEFMQHGFQYACAQTIAETQMLFQFAYPQIPNFHMNNVLAPLDIAFIDHEGTITDIFLMKTYSKIDLKKTLYSPSKTVLYALEARAGYFADLGAKVGDRVDIKK